MENTTQEKSRYMTREEYNKEKKALAQEIAALCDGKWLHMAIDACEQAKSYLRESAVCG